MSSVTVPSNPPVGNQAMGLPIVCGNTVTTRVQVNGSGFAPVTVDTLVNNSHLLLPKVILDERASDSGSIPVSGDIVVYDGIDQDHVNWQSAQQMTFDVYAGMVGSDPTGMPGTNLDYGLYDLSIQNPDTRRATLQSALAVVQPPQVTAVTPNPACNAQGMPSYTISGSHFLQVNLDVPAVTFTSTTNPQSSRMFTPTLSNCMPLPSPTGLMLQDCTTLTVTENPANNPLPPDDYRVTVANPDVANCASSEDPNNPSADRIVIIPPPTVTSSTTLGVCATADSTLTLSGTNFLLLSNPQAVPTLTINGMTFNATVDPTSCTPIVDAPNGQLCSSLSFTIPQNTFTAGTSYMATLQNPGMDACSVAMTLTINVVGPPTLTLVTPNNICSGGGTLNLTGTNIYSGGTAIIGRSPGPLADSQSLSGGGTMAQAQFGGPIQVTQPMTTDVTLQNAPGCSATLANSVVVTAGPSILFVDPPAVPSIISLQVTVYLSNINTKVNQIQIFPTGSNTAALTFNNPNTDPTLTRAFITLQAGALPAGQYDLKLTDNSVCQAFLPKGLTVVTNPTLTVTSTTPAFGSTAQNTATVIAGSGFVSIPRAYLSPSSGTGNAQALGAVTFTSATSLNAVVLSGLAAGQYDLIVVNPNGAFGIAKKAFTVTTAAAPPPVITSIAPSSVVQATATPVIVNGSGFRQGATLTLTCYSATNTVVTGSMASVSSVAMSGTSISGSITAASGSLYCILRASNSDGTYFDYSAVGVTNASGKLTGFTAATNLTTARRALTAVAGRPTAVARYVYAIGGDNGMDNAPIQSVEAAPTALNGNLGTFAVLSQKLPKALSFQGSAVIGRFIFVVGGFTGTAAAKDVYRAEILSPLNALDFSDADVLFNQTQGLAGGIYIYRISAVLGNTDANNPGGETLAGDFFPIQLPTLGSGVLQVQLFWPQVPGATSYNIYRTLKNAPAGSEKLLMTVSDTGMATQSVTDDGTKTPSGASPLPLGSTGVFMALPSLSTARAGAAVGVAQDPSTPGKWYLYAAGGNSGTLIAPTPLASTELLSITDITNGTVETQTIGTSWTAATSTLATARWAAAGLPATSANNNIIMPPNDTFLYVGGGSTTGLTMLAKKVESAQGMSGGQLGAFMDSGSVGMSRPGYGGVLVNNTMFAFGGFQAGSASNLSDIATLSAPQALGNFSSLAGGNLSQPRALQGTAIESAFIYQLGGASAGVNTAQVSTEQTIW